MEMPLFHLRLVCKPVYTGVIWAFLYYRFGFLYYNFINNSIRNGFLSSHPVVTVEIFHHFFKSLPTIVRQNLCAYLFCFQYFQGSYFYIARNASCSSTWLVDHYPGMGLDKSHSPITCRKQNTSH